MKEPPKDLADAVKRLTARNNELADYLGEGTTAIERVANAPGSTLAEVTDRASKYWKEREEANALRRSTPPLKGNWP